MGGNGISLTQDEDMTDIADANDDLEGEAEAPPSPVRLSEAEHLQLQLCRTQLESAMLRVENAKLQLNQVFTRIEGQYCPDGYTFGDTDQKTGMTALIKKSG